MPAPADCPQLAGCGSCVGVRDTKDRARLALTVPGPGLVRLG